VRVPSDFSAQEHGVITKSDSREEVQRLYCLTGTCFSALDNF